MVDDKEIQEIINAYDTLVKGIHKKATDNQDRAYGGIIRAGKGKMLESIAKILVKLAWKELGKEENRLKIIGTRILIPIQEDYIERLDDEEVKEHIKKNLKNYTYPYKPDVLVMIDDKPVLEIECKTYTENAMLKRILVDCTLCKEKYPDMIFILLQLESQLGGDYSELKDNPLGSTSSHTLLSHFDIDLNIITLLKGERKVDKPIHRKEFFKPLTKESLKISIEEIKEILRGVL